MDDVRLPIDLDKAVEGLENIHDVWKSKAQLFVIFGFMKISYEQKEVIKKREKLEATLNNMRIEQVFSILKDFTVKKRTKGIQADLLIAIDPIMQKVDSTATILDSFFSKNKNLHRNPFSKTKEDKMDGTSINADDSKISDPSFHTINLKMSKLENVLMEARKIREANQMTKRYRACLFEK